MAGILWFSSRCHYFTIMTTNQRLMICLHANNTMQIYLNCSNTTLFEYYQFIAKASYSKFHCNSSLFIYISSKTQQDDLDAKDSLKLLKNIPKAWFRLVWPTSVYHCFVICKWVYVKLWSLCRKLHIIHKCF